MYAVLDYINEGMADSHDTKAKYLYMVRRLAVLDSINYHGQEGISEALTAVEDCLRVIAPNGLWQYEGFDLTTNEWYCRPGTYSGNDWR